MKKYTEIAGSTFVCTKIIIMTRSTEFSFLRTSIQVEHEYTLVPLDKMKEEWWSEG